MRVGSVVIVICAFLLHPLHPTALALPAEVILLRHAEKPADSDDVHLSSIGKERAQALASLLTTSPALTNQGPPTILYATDWTRHNRSRRPFETLQPLAKALNLPIKRPYHGDEHAKLARHILTSPECEDQVVVVCWIHDSLPELAKALGVRPKPPGWKSHVYDRLWVITWPNRHAQLENLPQRLLPGDSKH